MLRIRLGGQATRVDALLGEGSEQIMVGIKDDGMSNVQFELFGAFETNRRREGSAITCR